MRIAVDGTGGTFRGDPADMTKALLDPRWWGPDDGQTWLRERYAELAPDVMPAVIVCLRTGQTLPESTRQLIAASARAGGNGPVPYSTALRGGLPIVAAVSRHLRLNERALNPSQTVELMRRAALIASELSACWVENWQTPVTTDSEDDLLVQAQQGAIPSPALEMVTLTAAGHSNDQIARKMSYSPQAVKWHLGRTMRSWGVSNRAALVTAAFVRGVLRPRAPQHPRLDVASAHPVVKKRGTQIGPAEQTNDDTP